ncbi:GNAT family N-acetyltransferase [Ectobacillus ponti]|uniref:N-acetyltransferase n=1 Tax=Ectobacillus ponti TaxID=2961894 RepID=A0AA41X6E4_9BACI|nr:GNAT family N-acetyltransferase [Ectobacillus ponti]MCP8967474.1 N-acetyltransferase [Ectobacillus ponti]
MIHTKIYNAKTLKTPKGTIIVEGPVSTQNLEHYDFHHDLTAFRPAPQQHQAIIEISRLPEARLIIARHEHMIVGYTTFLHPDPLERWSEGNMENLIELGAIEVIPEFRSCSVGKNMLQVAMMDDHMEDYITITTEYYWHWDLKRTGLNVWEYRNAMEKMMNAGGLEWMATDDPEICSHPANCLMVRIGKRVDQESVQRFDRLRFQNRFMY